MIPEIASLFKKNNVRFHFLLTAPKDNSHIHRKFLLLCQKYKVEEEITIMGTIKKEELESLYRQVDFVFLLSKLESFSNNIIEAYTFKKPLIVSNETWAKQLCGKAAIYVERNDPKDIFNKINKLINDTDSYDKYINLGSQQLKKFPMIEEKINQEFNFLKYVYKEYN